MKNISLTINGVLLDRLTVAEKLQEMLDGQEKRTRLDDSDGMIYVFSKDCKESFVNKNPYLDFDLIMVDVRGKITAIHTMRRATIPADLPAGKPSEEGHGKYPEYYSPTPYRYVFELKSGLARRIGATVGERLDVDYAQLYPFRNAENIRYAFQLKKVIFKQDWIAPLLMRMKEVLSRHDAVRELILDFIGGRHDIHELISAGWSHLVGIDTEESKNFWFQKEIRSGQQRSCARLCLSDRGHFRYLYFLRLEQDGAYLPVNENVSFDAEVQLLHDDLERSLLEKPTQTIEKELAKFVPNPQNTPAGEEWSENQAKFHIWAGEFSRLQKKSRYYNYRLLYGMLRFENFCDDDSVLKVPLAVAAKLEERWAMAKLITLSLTRASESKNPDFWNNLGFALDHMNEKEAALYCFGNAWNLKTDMLYAKNLWLMGLAIVPNLLRMRNWNSLFPIASAMLSAIPDTVTVKLQVEVLCLVGLIFESRDDSEEAADYYRAARQIYQEKNKEQTDSLRWDFPILYQALMRTTRMTDEKTCRRYVEAQLETFPKTPLEAGFDGRLPVDYVEGNGHGDHWSSVVKPEIFESAKFFETMIQEGELVSQGIDLPGYERGEDSFKRGIGFRYSKKNDSNSPLESYFLVGVTADGDSRQFASAFPVFRKGCGGSIIRPLRSLNVWSNAIEATAVFDLKENRNSLAFFLPNYCDEFLRLKTDTAYRIELGAFAYYVDLFQEQEFTIKRGYMLEEEKMRLRQAGKDDNIDSVKLHMTRDFCNITRSFSGWEDDISLVAPIERIEEFMFLGTRCLLLWLKFDERGAGMTLPVFLREGNLAEGYSPHVGDVVSCSCWLQGWVHEAHALGNAGGIQESEDEHDDACFDFANVLPCGVKGTDYDLDLFAFRALTQKGKAEALCRCTEALPGDADFSCRVNGSVKFVKVMTGYFKNEEECRSAWKKFRRQVAPRPDGRTVCLLSVVGINQDGEHYRIFYNGFSRLNPSVEREDFELDLDAEPDSGTLRTSVGREKDEK